MLFATVPRTKQFAGFAAVLLAIALVRGASTFPFRAQWESLSQSRPWAREMWRLHRELLGFAAGREVIVILPRNEYTYLGAAEFLLKGTANFNSWTVGEHGRPVLDGYAPRMTFRSEYSGTPPDSPFPRSSVIFWVDIPNLPPLIERYSGLRELNSRAAGHRRDWALSNGWHSVKAHAIEQ
jgi:hypothetical protein